MNKNIEMVRPVLDRPRHKKKKSLGETLFIIALLAYPIIQWVVFWLYPNIRTFVLPFMTWSYEENKYVLADPLFYNFQEQITEFFASGNGTEHSGVYMAFFNTFHALWINLALLPLAVIIGYALSKHVPGEKFFRVIFFMPNIISTVVMCFVFRFMLEDTGSAFTGPVAELLHGLGINFNGWDTRNQQQIWTLVYIYCIWTGLSINVVIISSSFQRIPKEIIESARLDGVSFFQEFFKIELPLIMPIVSTFLINSFIAVTAFYLQPYMLIGNTQDGGIYQTIPWIIFDLVTNSPNQDSYVGAATLGIMFSLIMFPLIMLARFVGKKLTPDVEF